MSSKRASEETLISAVVIGGSASKVLKVKLTPKLVKFSSKSKAEIVFEFDGDLNGQNGNTLKDMTLNVINTMISDGLSVACKEIKDQYSVDIPLIGGINIDHKNQRSKLNELYLVTIDNCPLFVSPMKLPNNISMSSIVYSIFFDYACYGLNKILNKFL